MLLWVGFAVLTAAVVAVLLRPLLASATSDVASSDAGEGPASSAAGAVYRDQLAEIDAEARRGLIGAGEAEAARVEIARRLLATSGTENGRAASAPARGSLTAVTMVLAVALPIGAIATYLAIGAPTQPGQPHASRGAPAGTAPGVSQLIAQVEERLRANPEDGRGWDVIGPVYLRMGRYNDAANAYQRALRLVGESPDRLAGLAESHVLASDGVVTEAARAAYARLGQLEPDRITPRFWLAVAAEQDGRFDEALAAYTTLLREGDEAAGWRPTVVERWRAVRTKLGQATDSPPAGKSAAAAPAGKAPALAKDTVDAAETMTPDARRQMIEDMVAGLDKRLSEDGRDLEGWQRLIRAYAVLGRRDQALAALKRAQAALAQEAPSLEVLGALAKSLGLAS